MMSAEDEPKTKSTSFAPSKVSEGKPKKRASSIFRSARLSFYRSGGKRGASVEKLRGTTGADFEAEGRINRGVEGFGCGCFGPSIDNSDVLIVIKGTFIFVYSSETAVSPNYAIALGHLHAKPKNQLHGRHIVALETSLGDIQYEFSFQEEDLATRFVKIVTEQSVLAERAEVKKKLGHDHLVSKRASVKFAEQVAQEKCKEAPPKIDVDMNPADLNYAAGAAL